MNWADWIILAIVAISTLIGLSRGFVREILSLITWMAAFVVAILFRQQLAPLLSNLVETPALQELAASALLFVGTLLAGAGLNILLSSFISATGLSAINRVLGMGFGLVRGSVAVLALLMFVPMLLPVAESPWWWESTLIPAFLRYEDQARELVAGLQLFLATQID